MQSKYWAACLVLIMFGVCPTITKIDQATATPLPQSQANTPTPAPQPADTESVPPATLLPTQSPTSQSIESTDGPSLAGCPIFPSDHIWNTPIDTLPVDPHSDDYIDSIGRDTGLHPDFGAGLYDDAPIGIPYTIADSTTPRSEVSFDYDDESDAGPYPIPADAAIEGGPDSDGDRHILIVEKDECKLYELYDAYPNEGGNWDAGSGAIWDLRGYALRPEGWTSADAAGLAILPGLVRYEEVAADEIKHALRFTAEDTQAAYIWPARHKASDAEDPGVPPMGQHFRLKADFDITPYPPDVQIIFKAMQTYGLILADNGSNWFVSGTPNDHWDNDILVESFRQVTGDDFEAVDVSSLMTNSNSGRITTP